MKSKLAQIALLSTTIGLSSCASHQPCRHIGNYPEQHTEQIQKQGDKTNDKNLCKKLWDGTKKTGYVILNIAATTQYFWI